MADTKISELNEIEGVPVEDDVLAIVDTDAAETKKVRFSKLAGVTDPEGDKIWEDPVIDKDLADPPVGPADEDRYLVAPASNWFNPAWPFRRQLTTDDAEIAEDETHAVVSVEINAVDDPGSASLFTEAQVGGQDLVFCDSDGITPLSFDIERWDPGNEVLVARVRIPLLDADAPYNIFIYYGSDLAHYTPPEGTYPASWGLFYEMRSGGLDRTAYGRNIAAVIGTPTESSNNSGYEIEFDGTDPDAWSLLNVFYIEQEWATRTHAAIIRTGTDIVTRQVIYAEGGTTNGYTLYIRDSRIYVKWWSKSKGWNGDHLLTDGDIAINTLYYITTIYEEGGEYQLFVNGVEHDAGAHNVTVVMNAHSGDGGIAYTGGSGKLYDNGSSGGNSNYLGGADVCDVLEFNICDDAWSLNRHITWFNNRFDNAAFWTIGAEVNQTGAGGAWAGHDNEITEWDDPGSVWVFTPPVDGMTTWVADESKHYSYDGDEGVWKVSYGLMSHDNLSNVQGGVYGPPAQQYHMTEDEHIEATRDATNEQNGLMPAGKLDNWDTAYEFRLEAVDTDAGTAIPEDARFTIEGDRGINTVAAGKTVTVVTDIAYCVLYMDVLALDLEHIVTLRPWQDETIVPLDGAFRTQPDVPRNLFVDCFASPGIMTGTVTINGIDADGATIQEVVTVNVGGGGHITYSTDRAFATLISIVTDQTDVNFGATYSVGISSLLGLPNYPFNAAGDVFKVKVLAVDISVPPIDVVYGTVDFTAIIIAGGDDITFWYRPFM